MFDFDGKYFYEDKNHSFQKFFFFFFDEIIWN